MSPVATPTAILTIIPNQQPILVTLSNQQPNVTNYAAWAGFTLSFFLACFEIWKYYNNRAILKITYRFNLEIMKMNAYGDLTKEPSNKTYWTVDIANVGSKNIIITSIAFSHFDTKKMSMLTRDLLGPIRRHTVIPGDNHSYTISTELLDPKKVNEVFIYDATGKVYKKRIRYKEW